MNYQIHITVLSKGKECELFDKYYNVPDLANITTLDLASVYASAQQVEIEEGLDINELDANEYGYESNN